MNRRRSRSLAFAAGAGPQGPLDRCETAFSTHTGLEGYLSRRGDFVIQIELPLLVCDLLPAVVIKERDNSLLSFPDEFGM